jgi:Golgi phosphoprotein 3 (GPP34)
VRLGDLSLSENLFFLAHDPFTGAPRTKRAILDIGLSGAVLADLLLDERITLRGDTVVLASRSPTGEPIADRALDHMVGEAHRHSVRDWVDYMRTGAFDAVVETLTVRELLTLKEKRGMFKLSLHYEPADLRAASAPRALLRTAMLGQSACDEPTAALAALAQTIGMTDFRRPEFSRRQVAQWIGAVRSTLNPPLAGLLAAIEAAMAAATTGGRR